MPGGELRSFFGRIVRARTEMNAAAARTSRGAVGSLRDRSSKTSRRSASDEADAGSFIAGKTAAPLATSASGESPRIQRRGSTIENLDSLPRALCPAESETEHHRRVAAAVGVRCAIDSLLQVIVPAGLARAGLGHPQIEQDRRLLLGGRGLGERPPQECRPSDSGAP